YLSRSRDTLPPGYLFLCPLADLQWELPTWFQLPDCPAYWSLDPSGTERLSAKAARNLGFPDLRFQMKAVGRFWNDGVYAGIRQFQEAKGFDPYSQEVARELGISQVRFAFWRAELESRE
ncbi:hypothetical protein K438DRAFT_1615618, partial [Mycena galopus ATCC 62051]